MSFPGMQYQRLYYTGNRCCSQGKIWVLAVGDIAGDCHNDNLGATQNSLEAKAAGASPQDRDVG